MTTSIVLGSYALAFAAALTGWWSGDTEAWMAAAGLATAGAVAAAWDAVRAPRSPKAAA